MDGESGDERLLREINGKTGLTVKCNNFHLPIIFPYLGELQMVSSRQVHYI
jgi:hypothetical protein